MNAQLDLFDAASALLRGSPWLAVHKGDLRARALADRHYTRKRPGHPQWTRPGYNYVLVTPCGRACFVWWRPKYEAGVERYDGLRCLECTIFRREGPPPHLGGLPEASELVEGAVSALDWPEAWQYLGGELPICAQLPTLLVTGVGSRQTAARQVAPPGRCFREAGFVDLDHKVGRADVWLQRTREVG